MIKFKRAFYQLLGFIPTALPFGVYEFELWASRIIFTYDLPNNDSTRWALATMILHSGQTEATKPIRYFGRCARKGGANEVANYTMVTLKNKQKVAEEARLEALAQAKRDEEVAAAGSQAV